MRRSVRKRALKRKPKYHIGTPQQARVRELTEGIDPSKVLLVAIDASKFFHAVLICTAEGKIVAPPFEIDIYNGGFTRLRQATQEASSLVQAQRVLVGIESTGHYHENLVRHLQNDVGLDPGVRVILINPFSTNEMRNLNLNTIKSDDIDLDAIAELMMHSKGTMSNLPEGIYLDLRDLTRFRRAKVDERKRLKQQIVGHMDRIWPGLINPHEKDKSLFEDFWNTKAAMLVLRLCPSPHQVLELGIQGIKETFAPHDYRLTVPLARRIVRHAESALKPRPQDIQTRLDLLGYDMHVLSAVQAVVAKVEARIVDLVMQTPGKFLLTIRGVAEMTAAEVVAEIGPPTAYDHADAVVKLAGLNPSYYQTGQTEATDNHITKFGRSSLRGTAVSAARRLIRQNPYFKKYYDRLVTDRGKHGKVALCATARKFLCICFAMMRDGATFCPPEVSDSALVGGSLRRAGVKRLDEANQGTTEKSAVQGHKACVDTQPNTCLDGAPAADPTANQRGRQAVPRVRTRTSCTRAS